MLALSMLASCDAGDAQSSSSHRSAAPTASSSAVASGQPSPVPPGLATCAAVETRPRWLLTPGDAWSEAEHDGMAQNAFVFGEACDGGPEWSTWSTWPESCDLFGDLLLDEAWPGYRTEGVYYIAGISLFNQSGENVSERILLFGTPSSGGLRILADQAQKCGATRKSSAGKAVIYQFPSEPGRQRYLIVQRTVAIQLSLTHGVKASPMIEKALRRAAEAG
ncbi:hypothetical protein FHR83_001772 [Actinoplanes campanulatus]|uniref:DUF3558 domain-containing protein n=1 Tax=Actinoplanes campanulatus TaxID=113559 RepID=A0A7W5FDB3_9ACTN|nr:hypothetical protein [Actinoplanes campanulatus]MBB3094120.1 hypothetical protein [Actinoplanes campanulatus]